MVWYGRKSGTVMLCNRKPAVQRQKGPGGGKDVRIPAYESMRDEPRLGARMLDIVMRGVSARQYRGVKWPDAMGMSKTTVSRQIDQIHRSFGSRSGGPVMPMLR